MKAFYIFLESSGIAHAYRQFRKYLYMLCVLLGAWVFFYIAHAVQYVSINWKENVFPMVAAIMFVVYMTYTMQESYILKTDWQHVSPAPSDAKPSATSVSASSNEEEWLKKWAVESGTKLSAPSDEENSWQSSSSSPVETPTSYPDISSLPSDEDYLESMWKNNGKPPSDTRDPVFKSVDGFELVF